MLISELSLRLLSIAQLNACAGIQTHCKRGIPLGKVRYQYRYPGDNYLLSQQANLEK